MNMTTSGDMPGSQPRIVCRVARFWNAIGGSAVRHCTDCPDCQRYFSRAQDLDSALTREAADARTALTDTTTLEHAILRAVRTSAAEASVRESRAGFRGWTLIAGAAAMAVAAVVALGPNANFRSERGRGSNPSEDAAVLMTTVQSISSEFVTSVIPSAGELVAENPLQHELGSVYSDVRSAIDFLALNFLPASRSTSALPPARQI
jgi:hypothetical protein